MTTPNLLVELFVEELPPKALKKLGQAFADTLVASLRAQGLANGDSITITSSAMVLEQLIGKFMTNFAEQKSK